MDGIGARVTTAIAAVGRRWEGSRHCQTRGIEGLHIRGEQVGLHLILCAMLPVSDSATACCAGRELVGGLLQCSQSG